MSTTDIVTSVVWEDCGATLLARIIGWAGTSIVQADVASIACKVFDVGGATPTVPVATPAMAVASVVFDTLQTDARWTKDATGYNFRHTFVATTFATGGHWYRVEVVVTPTTGEVYAFGRRLYAQALWGS